MIVTLKRFTIATTRNIKGRVVVRRYGYVIALKRHWWNKPRYLRLIHDWPEALNNGNDCKIELKESFMDATTFKEGGAMDYCNVTAAKTIIGMIKEQPDKFILS